MILLKLAIDVLFYASIALCASLALMGNRS